MLRHINSKPFVASIRFAGPVYHLTISKELWYNILGMKEFLKMRKNLTYTPVSRAAQKQFADTFIITKTPVFGFLKRDLLSSGKQANN